MSIIFIKTCKILHYWYHNICTLIMSYFIAVCFMEILVTAIWRWWDYTEYLVFQSSCFGLAAIINTYPWSCSSRNPELEPWRTQGNCLKVTSVPSYNGLVSNLLGCSPYQCYVDPTHIHCKWQKDLKHFVQIQAWPISWKKRINKNI